MANSFIVERLTGEYVLDHHSASQCDPLYDMAAERWADDWAAEIAPGLPLPRLVWPGEVVGQVTRRGRGRDRPAGRHAGRGRHDRRLGRGAQRRRARARAT